MKSICFECGDHYYDVTDRGCEYTEVPNPRLEALLTRVSCPCRQSAAASTRLQEAGWTIMGVLVIEIYVNRHSNP